MVQEKHQEEKACDKRHPYRIIIIIIINFISKYVNQNKIQRCRSEGNITIDLRETGVSEWTSFT